MTLVSSIFKSDGRELVRLRNYFLLNYATRGIAVCGATDVIHRRQFTEPDIMTDLGERRTDPHFIRKSRRGDAGWVTFA